MCLHDGFQNRRKEKAQFSFSILVQGCIGVMENIMETTIACWGYMGIMEKKMETFVHQGGKL